MTYHPSSVWRWIAVIVLCCAALGWPPEAAGSASRSITLEWTPLDEGLQVAVWSPGSACGGDVPSSVLLRIDPNLYRFAVYQYVDERLSAPLTIREWQRRTGAVVLFNAGLFREDYSYMGLLLKGGRALERKRHVQWQGLFAAEPMDGGLPKARIFDLAAEPFVPERPGYREAAQALMLLDRTGKPRVRNSGKRAHQTVVIEFQDGDIGVLKTADAAPLWELATCLRETMPGIDQAMAMDGGASSDVMISDELADEWGSATGPDLLSLLDGTGMRHIPLPTVIGVLPR